MQLDWVTFVLEVVNFLVLVWILQHFLYKPVLATIARRREAIEKQLADAKATEQTADDLAKKYRDRLSEWQKEKESLRAKADVEIDKERQRRLAEIQQELDREQERRKAIETRQAAELRSKFRQEANAEALDFAASLLGRIASPEVEGRLVAVLLQDLESLPLEKREAVRDAFASANGKAQIASAYPLADGDQQQIVAALQSISDSPIDAQFSTETSVVAGLRVSIGPIVLRANIADELQFFGEGPVNAV